MNEDWLPPELPKSGNRLSLAWWGVGLVGFMGFVILLYSQAFSPSQSLVRRKALGEVRFLFEAKGSRVSPLKYSLETEVKEQSSSSYITKIKPKSEAVHTSSKTQALSILESTASQAPNPEVSRLKPTKSKIHSTPKLIMNKEEAVLSNENDQTAKLSNHQQLPESKVVRAPSPEKQEHSVQVDHKTDSTVKSQQKGVEDIPMTPPLRFKTITKTESNSSARASKQKPKMAAALKSTTSPLLIQNTPKSVVETMTWDQAKFTLQVKAFRSKEEAASFLDLIDQSWPDLPTRLLTATSKNRPIYRILLGAFKSKAAARAVRNDFMVKFGTKDKPFIKSIK